MAGATLADDVGHGGGVEPDKGYEAAQVKVGLLVAREHLQGAAAHQAEVGVVVNALNAHARL